MTISAVAVAYIIIYLHLHTRRGRFPQNPGKDGSSYMVIEPPSLARSAGASQPTVLGQPRHAETAKNTDRAETTKPLSPQTIIQRWHTRARGSASTGVHLASKKTAAVRRLRRPTKVIFLASFWVEPHSTQVRPKEVGRFFSPECSIRSHHCSVNGHPINDKKHGAPARLKTWGSKRIRPPYFFDDVQTTKETPLWPLADRPCFAPTHGGEEEHSRKEERTDKTGRQIYPPPPLALAQPNQHSKLSSLPSRQNTKVSESAHTTFFFPHALKHFT